MQVRVQQHHQDLGVCLANEWRSGVFDYHRDRLGLAEHTDHRSTGPLDQYGHLGSARRSPRVRAPAPSDHALASAPAVEANLQQVSTLARLLRDSLAGRLCARQLPMDSTSETSVCREAADHCIEYFDRLSDRLSLQLPTAARQRYLLQESSVWQ